MFNLYNFFSPLSKLGITKGLAQGAQLFFLIIPHIESYINMAHLDKGQGRLWELQVPTSGSYAEKNSILAPL